MDQTMMMQILELGSSLGILTEQEFEHIKQELISKMNK
jgi:hypothetical protein